MLESKGYSFIDQDDRILSPFTTVQERMMGITYVSRIVLTADDSNVLPQIEADVTNLLQTATVLLLVKKMTLTFRTLKIYLKLWNQLHRL